MSKKVILNFVLFQIGWFACVLGAANQQPWVGVITVSVFLVWHFFSAKNAGKEMTLLLIALVAGGAFDQIMQVSNLLTYQSHGWNNNIAPVWIIALWAIFVTTLNVSLRWMHGRWLIAFVFGFIGGPLAYMGAERLGAVSLNLTPASHIALAVGWAILTPLLVKLSQRFDGFNT